MGDFTLLGSLSQMEAAGTDLTNTRGIVILSSGTQHTKGSWVELIASTAFPTNSVAIINTRNQSSTSGKKLLLDIGIGGAGSEEVIIPNLLISQNARNNETSGNTWNFPVEIPAGTRISGRTQTDQTTSRSVAPHLLLSSHGFFGGAAGSEVITYGVTVGSTLGKLIDGGATADTKGSYVEITSSTAEALKGFCLSFGGNGNTAQGLDGDFFIDIAIGGSGSEEIIVPNLFANMNAAESFHHQQIYYDIAIPSGTRIAMRGQCANNDATDRIIEVALHGVH